MKANELMIGDWVFYNGKPHYVIAIESDDMVKITTPDKSDEWCRATWPDRFEPVPLTPEEELTEFEKALEVFLMNADSSEETFQEEVKKHAAELLELAKKELCDQIVDHTKEAYENGKADVLKEIEQDPENSYYTFKRGLEYGKEKALKDLPRWKKGIIPKGELAIRQVGISQHAYGVVRGGFGDSIPTQRYILISALEKLPGFNE